ncbi:hypothetical protein SmJEL517_g02429 [Synchytrium microbalum]|uniref:Peptidase M48 domain-containing protein n=1 Tax=Synchytrium microbalum TaxID=1806994 RepID=A0A507CAK0_9FUNG|nr:uncharacterized protein SmJEL517_g02429 [Synchytrium microbalum]TPX35036.1 hypothetical protein SmJEL517_g02429 [Synchytrium microbalum]
MPSRRIPQVLLLGRIELKSLLRTRGHLRLSILVDGDEDLQLPSQPRPRQPRRPIIARQQHTYLIPSSHVATIPKLPTSLHRISTVKTPQVTSGLLQHQFIFKSRFHSTPPARKTLLIGALSIGFYNSLRTIVTAMPVLWKWNFFKRYPKTMWSLVGIAGVSTLGWVLLSYEQHPLTQRGRFMFVDEPTELKIAETFYRDFVAKHINRFLPATHPDFIRVKQVAESIVTVVGPVRDWELFVVDDLSVSNAFVIATGKIFVYRGLLVDCPTQSHLAAVLSHEIAHVLSRHAVEKMGFSQLSRILYDMLHSALYTLSVNLPVVSDILGRTVDASEQVLSQLPYSRMVETEADTIGIYLMSMAGYDPRASVDLWERWALAEQASSIKDRNSDAPTIRLPELLSDHPSHGNRARDLRDHVAGALKIYDARNQLQEALQKELGNAVKPLASQDPAAASNVASTIKSLTIDEVDRALFRVLEDHITSQPFWWASDIGRQDILEKSLSISSLKSEESKKDKKPSQLEYLLNTIRWISLPSKA